MTVAQTLPDRIVELLKKHNGILVDRDGRVPATIALQVNERDVAKVDDALDMLAREGLIRRGGGGRAAKKVELTADGWKGGGATKPAAAAGNGSAPPSSKAVAQLASGEVLEAVDPNDFVRFPKRGGKRSWASRVIEAFMQSCEPVVKLRGLQGKPQAKRSSIDSYLRKENLRDKVLVRVVDDELYLARRDIVELDVEGGA